MIFAYNCTCLVSFSMMVLMGCMGYYFIHIYIYTVSGLGFVFVCLLDLDWPLQI